jgi:hypothetical protein
MNDFQDVTPLEKVWYRGKMPEVRGTQTLLRRQVAKQFEQFRVMEPHELPKDAKLGMSCTSSPPLLWLLRDWKLILVQTKLWS